MAVLALVAFLAVMLLPALARTKVDSRAFQCLNNNRELNRAWRMWTDDNDDQLLASSEGSEPLTPWMTGHLDFSPQGQSNWNPDTDIKKSPMWPYAGTNLKLWRCPADQSYVVINGVPRLRVRSFAMNVYFWTPLDYSPFNLYRSFRKLSDVTDPSPASLFVFLDMREDSIDYGNFAVGMDGYSPRNPAVYQFFDLPGAYHDGAAGFTYVDGHGELHRWQDRRTTPPLVANGQVPDQFATPRNADIAWLQDRATRPK